MKKEKQELALRIMSNGKYRLNVELGIFESFRKGDGVWKPLSGTIVSSGYLQHNIHLGRGKNTKCIVYAHILSYLVTNGMYDEGLVINHKDLNRLNNKPSNLEAISTSDNVNHSYENNVIFKEGVSHVSKIRYEEICKIKALMDEHPNWNKSKIARELGLNRIPVTRIINKINNGEELKFGSPGKVASPNAKKRIINEENWTSNEHKKEISKEWTSEDSGEHPMVHESSGSATEEQRSLQ